MNNILEIWPWESTFLVSQVRILQLFIPMTNLTKLHILDNSLMRQFFPAHIKKMVSLTQFTSTSQDHLAFPWTFKTCYKHLKTILLFQRWKHFKTIRFQLHVIARDKTMLKKKVFKQMFQYFQQNTIASKRQSNLISAVTDYRKHLSLLNNWNTLLNYRP